jgi:phosphoribosylaminoimidazolecarboxamide formyltransferase/IMP cyclohydrolase
VLQGKPLSYNNILDLDAAAGLVAELKGPSVVAVKHNNPCGVASKTSLLEALEAAVKSDPVSVFGGILALNEVVTKSEAEQVGELFLECIVAPDFSAEALAIFSKKKNLRLLRWPSMLVQQRSNEIRGISGGFLVQAKDRRGSDSSQWQYLGEQPSVAIMFDLKLAEKVCASLKSNSIALVKKGQTVGLGMGQVNRVDAVQQAVERMLAHHGRVNDLVLASDAFFPFPDSIEKAAAAGVRWILQPGGSVKDQAVFDRAKVLGINMIITGVRHFRH